MIAQAAGATPSSLTKIRKNGDLRGTPSVRVIGARGEMHGVMSLSEALRLALKEGLDLVEVNPKSAPPVCKLLDFGRYTHEATRQSHDRDAQSEALSRVWDAVHPRIVEHRASAAEAAFGAVWLLQAEIDNGGFAQYMFNSTGDQAAAAREALAEINAGNALTVFDEFSALLPGGRAALTRDARQEQLDAIASEYGEERFAAILEDLDQRFYVTEEELCERLYAFVIASGLGRVP